MLFMLSTHCMEALTVLLEGGGIAGGVAVES